MHLPCRMRSRSKMRCCKARRSSTCDAAWPNQRAASMRWSHSCRCCCIHTFAAVRSMPTVGHCWQPTPPLRPSSSNFDPGSSVHWPINTAPAGSSASRCGNSAEPLSHLRRGCIMRGVAGAPGIRRRLHPDDPVHNRPLPPVQGPRDAPPPVHHRPCCRGLHGAQRGTRARPCRRADLHRAGRCSKRPGIGWRNQHRPTRPRPHRRSALDCRPRSLKAVWRLAMRRSALLP